MHFRMRTITVVLQQIYKLYKFEDKRKQQFLQTIDIVSKQNINYFNKMLKVV